MPPPPPTGVQASDGTSCNTVVVTWNAVAGVGAYDVWRGPTSEFALASKLATAVSALPFADTAALPGIPMSYFVLSRNAGQVSVPSIPDVGVTALPAPGPSSALVTMVAESRTAHSSSAACAFFDDPPGGGSFLCDSDAHEAGTACSWAVADDSTTSQATMAGHAGSITTSGGVTISSSVSANFLTASITATTQTNTQPGAFVSGVSTNEGRYAVTMEVHVPTDASLNLDFATTAGSSCADLCLDLHIKNPAGIQLVFFSICEPSQGSADLGETLLLPGTYVVELIVRATSGSCVTPASTVQATLAGTLSPHPVPPCPADLTGDQQVNAADLAVLLAGWGSSGPADLDGNGHVDSADLSILLGSWGPC